MCHLNQITSVLGTGHQGLDRAPVMAPSTGASSAGISKRWKTVAFQERAQFYVAKR